MPNFNSKWIHFVRIQSTGKTQIWQVVTNEGNTLLGQIKWFGNWRKYAFYPENFTVFESTCLTDITKFLDGLMLERRAESLKNGEH